MRFEFGVMSSKWEMECEDLTQAYITMAMFIGKNVPVAVYRPHKYGFMPKDILDINQEAIKPSIVKDAWKTIKEISGDNDKSRGNLLRTKT